MRVRGLITQFKDFNPDAIVLIEHCAHREDHLSWNTVQEIKTVDDYVDDDGAVVLVPFDVPERQEIEEALIERIAEAVSNAQTDRISAAPEVIDLALTFLGEMGYRKLEQICRNQIPGH